MSFILKRENLYYKRFTETGPLWTTDKDEAFRFPFESMASNVAKFDHRVLGSTIETYHRKEDNNG